MSAPIDFDNAFVLVRACEDCAFFMDGIEGFFSGEAVLRGEQTHRERSPAHRITSERYPLKEESGRGSVVGVEVGTHRNFYQNDEVAS